MNLFNDRMTTTHAIQSGKMLSSMGRRQWFSTTNSRAGSGMGGPRVSVSTYWWGSVPHTSRLGGWW